MTDRDVDIVARKIDMMHRGRHAQIQVGMLLALAEAEITPDMIVGTSVGAMNGGWVASRCDAAGIAALADLWRSLTRGKVFPTSLTAGLLGFLGQRRNLVPDTGIRNLLKHHLGFRRLEEAPIPLHVVATDGGTALPHRADHLMRPRPAHRCRPLPGGAQRCNHQDFRRLGLTCAVP